MKNAFHLHWVTWGSLLLVVVALAWCEGMPRCGSPSSDPDEVVAHGWPLIAYSSEWYLRTEGLSIPLFVGDRWHPLTVAVDAAVCIAIVFTVVRVVERWLQLPNRFAYRLSTLLKLTALVACLVAFSISEDNLAFSVLHQMDRQVDYSPDQSQRGPAFKTIALAGLGCVLLIAISSVTAGAKQVAARIKSRAGGYHSDIAS
jgi:hypothetical protein